MIKLARAINRVLNRFDIHVTRRTTFDRMQAAQRTSDVWAEPPRAGLSNRGQAISADRRQVIEAELASIPSWYHAFEIFPGIVTPGSQPIEPAGVLDGHWVPPNLTGKTALDVGAWDGPLSFELERRGATVTALDIQDPARTGFNVSKRLLESKVEYVRGSVYDLNTLLPGRGFDVILFHGVFYHLKNPIGAFEALAAALSSSGRLHFEGECFLGYAEDIDGHPANRKLLEIARSNIPVALCYPGRYKGASNWFVPNLACLKSWLEAAGLKLEHLRLWEDAEASPYPGQRIIGTALKEHARATAEEHPIV